MGLLPGPLHGYMAKKELNVGCFFLGFFPAISLCFRRVENGENV